MYFSVLFLAGSSDIQKNYIEKQRKEEEDL